ncbi:pilin N-terminal domain-containing protein [Helcococcus bovis]|uniref:pilin N-terminal domain-containing protein n=1 Tax=Helcococcus bovis TaxID=3153252 RepID=UPI0038B99B71
MKKRILSAFLAFIMVFAMAAPLVRAAEVQEQPKGSVTGTLSKEQLQEAKPDKTDINIYKLKADNYNSGAPWLHNGGAIDPKDYTKLGTNVSGLAGVRFTVYKMKPSGASQKYTKADYDQLDTMVKDRANYATAQQVNQTNKFEIVTASDDNKLDSSANNQTKATDSKGLTTVSLPDGIYWVIETERPSDVTGSIAVPFGITLPLTNSVDVDNVKAGTQYLKNVNVYPKNLTKKDKIDKAFGNPNDLTLEDKAKLDSKKLAELQKQWDANYGPKVDEYTRNKAAIDARIGSEVPFQSVTVLSQGKRFKNISWSDMMTDGLEYVKNSLKITAKFTVDQEQTEVVTNQLKITDQGTYGFDVENKDDDNNAFIKKLNTWLEKGDVTITFDYKAKVTKLNVVDSPESNTISFTPNKPNHNNNFETPQEGNIKVEKTWAEGTEVPTNVLVTYNLIENDGENKKVVATVTLKNNGVGEGAIQSKSLNKDMTVTADGDYKVTFKGLDDKKTYTVEEFADGYKPEYLVKSLDGQINIKNHFNPGSITPTPPQVVTGGKKFVKVDQQDPTKRLAGAEFVVKKDDEYLVIKDDKTKLEDNEEYKKAKESYEKAIDAMNAALAKGEISSTNKVEYDDKSFEEKDLALKEIKKLEKARNEAFEKLNYTYSWGTKDDAYRFVSNADGQFEVKGLAYGTYNLEEIKAPAGYAKIEQPIQFEINENSYKDNSGDIAYKLDEGNNDATKVNNRKLSIPQTGGIGTIIFTVAGLIIMGGAIYALKKNNQEVEA